MAPDPRGASPLELRPEYVALCNEIRNSLFGWLGEIEFLRGCSVDQITKVLDHKTPEILQISCHGSLEGICFEDAAGATININVAALGRILQRQSKLRLVILSCCYGSEHAQPLANAVGMVVAMVGEVLDDSAIAFTREFHHAFGFGLPLQDAVERAKAAVNMRDPSFDAGLSGRKSC
jgi:hypothetical protein